jgi:NosR/NirI family nitrous oxide reductase transcriptional regulator
MLRHLFVALGLVAAGGVFVAGQTRSIEVFQKVVMPTATSFSAKEGQPPHFKAYVADPKTGQQTLAGFVFWTTELEPLERGYDGPIKMIIGMDTSGVITGLVVVEQHEPFGSFSVAPPKFAAQFKGKSIRDPFKLGQDVDAVATATITMTSATRAIKNAARRMARQYLTPEAVK